MTSLIIYVCAIVYSLLNNFRTFCGNNSYLQITSIVTFMLIVLGAALGLGLSLGLSLRSSLETITNSLFSFKKSWRLLTLTEILRTILLLQITSSLLLAFSSTMGLCVFNRQKLYSTLSYPQTLAVVDIMEIINSTLLLRFTLKIILVLFLT